MACRGSKRVVLIFLYCRLILFAEMYCIHYLGVEHGDFEPQNVLRKRWSCSLKIIDFGFSDVDIHVQVGGSVASWKTCGISSSWIG
jgi:serine/threonine protein kinase